MPIKNKILVLGNSRFINEIQFDRLPLSIKTFGVNRIWLAHFPTYYFFHDIPIIRELDENPIMKAKLISKSSCFSSDWINKFKYTTPVWLRKYPRFNRRTFPDSITTGMDILSRHILPGRLSEYTFYMAGISLQWENPSHFWKELGYKSRNTNDESWYNVRFKKMFKNIKHLKDSGFDMVSVTPNSMINKILRYENIANHYIK